MGYDLEVVAERKIKYECPKTKQWLDDIQRYTLHTPDFRSEDNIKVVESDRPYHLYCTLVKQYWDSNDADYVINFLNQQIQEATEDKYNYLTRRYKRRNRKPKYNSKKHRDFCLLMDSFGYYNVLEDLSLEQIKNKLQPFLLWLKRHYELVLLPRDPDFRSGFDTYSYTDVFPTEGKYNLDINEEYIKGVISYISDRWQCSFRVRWIINLLDPNYDYSSFNSNP